jgi:type VI secretion system protein ImpA
MERQDVETLLSPIDGASPCGVDLRETSSPDYQALKDARRQIASLVRARKFDQDSSTEINTHWQTIYRLAPTVIKEQSKDLEVAAWFTEAALKLQGYAGLRSAFELNEGLVSRFFDDVYPLPDEDGIETRVYPLIGLNGEDGNGTLILPLKNVPLSEDMTLPFTHNLYTRCLDAENISDPDAKRQRIDEIGLSLETIHTQVQASSEEFYRQLIDDLNACLTHFNSTTRLLDEKCGLSHSPPSSAIKKTLEDVLNTLTTLTRSKLASKTDEEHSQPGSYQTDGNTSSARGIQQTTRISASVGNIHSRDDALNQLLIIANYFRQTEPHSPLCGAIERVVKWGNCSLQELMMTLIPDASARAVYTQLTGIDLGEGATPIGQLSQSAKVIQSAPVATETPKPAEPVADPFGQSHNTSGW